MYRPSSYLRPVLYLPSLLFELAVRTRNLSYASGLLSAARLPCPVISVGNLTLGGSGKTPLVMFIARSLIALGYIPAVLSRGYGRKSLSSSRIVPPARVISPPDTELGDEPALIRRSLPETWLGVASNRHAVGRRIAALCPEVVFILDDGFQHRQLYRDLDIVVVDGSQPLLRNRLFPLGSLREPLSSLRRAQTIILTGPDADEETDSTASVLQGMIPDAVLLRCIQRIGGLVPMATWKSPACQQTSPVSSRRVFLVAALGNPGRFQGDVADLGIDVAGCRFFRDHHRLTPRDWRKCIESARYAGAEAIVVTEKDAIKILQPVDFPVLVAVQSTVLDRPVEFQRILLKAVGNPQ